MKLKDVSFDAGEERKKQAGPRQTSRTIHIKKDG